MSLSKRELGLGAMLLTAVACTALAWLSDPIKTRLHQGHPTQPTVLLVVLDTVRADHLGACGYHRPTSPVLRGLVESGGSLSCEGVATGSWTFPSHASLFTGLEVPEHGAHFVGDQALLRSLAIQPLSDEHATLAEALSAQGFQTRGVSGNPVLNQASGLGRGFGDWRVAPGFGPWNGAGLIEQLKGSLREADPDKSLFLFVNIADAHDPWYPPTDELDWVPAHPGTLAYFEVDDAGQVLPDGPWQRYVQGRMDPTEAEALRTEVSDRYDRALWQADRTLGQVLEQVRAHGWDQAGLRVVVTSDHGEFLGEHGILRHGRYLYEENSRVPLLVWDSAGVEPLPSGPLSILEARELVLGQPLAGHPTRAVAFPDPLWAEQSGGVLGTELSAAIWGPQGEKELWVAGQSRAYHLDQDPQEHSGTPVPASEVMLERVQAAQNSAARQIGGPDPGLEAALQAAGYLDGG
ncbi:MAG: sulfatase-like hydrolase/transferase [Myxococcota bacterium]|nr:sulfatase-like hydrolase/transferase [Myxococcota bacterium]